MSRGPGDGEKATSGGRAKTRRDSCSVCSYIGRCPVNEPLTQEEFESAVKVRGEIHDDGGSTNLPHVVFNG